MKNFLQWLKNPKTFALIGFAFITLVGLPVVIYLVQQQQITRPKAAVNVWNSGKDTCGHIQITKLSETPMYQGKPVDCSSQVALIDSYQTTVTMKSLDGQTYNNVSVLYQSFWCNYIASDLGDGVNPNACIHRNNGGPAKTYTVDSNGVTIPGNVQKSTDWGYSDCGVYQNDVSFTYTDHSGQFCRFGYDATDPNPNHPVLAAGYCTTQVLCQAASPTPTHTPTPTMSPTPTLPVPSDTPTNTPSPTLTPSPTATPSATPTSTPGPSPTPTVTTTPGPSGVDLPPTCTKLTADRGLTGPAPYALTFSGSGTDSDGTIQKAIFTFSDEASPETVTVGGGIGTGTVNVQLTHNFQNAGSYTATVAFVDNANLQSAAVSACSLSIKVTVPPTGHYTSPGPTTVIVRGPSPLPPTGTSVVNIGIIGAAIAILGGLLLVGAL